MAVPQTVNGVIDATIQRIQTKGWCKGTMQDSKGRSCLAGAMIIAAHGQTDKYYTANHDLRFNKSMNSRRVRLNQAYVKVIKAINKAFPRSSVGGPVEPSSVGTGPDNLNQNKIVSWNDSRRGRKTYGSAQDQVLAVLNMAKEL